MRVQHAFRYNCGRSTVREPGRQTPTRDSCPCKFAREVRHAPDETDGAAHAAT